MPTASQLMFTIAQAERTSERAVEVFKGYLGGRQVRQRTPRKVDGEDASFVRQVAGRNPAVVRLSGPSAERQPETQAGSIGASLLERPEQVARIPGRETAAFVLDLD